jgi:hypothetical protein
MARAILATGLVAVFLLLAPVVKAQQPITQSTSKPTPQVESQPQSQPPTAEAMGVSRKSVRRQAEPPPKADQQSKDWLHYDFLVNVYGKRPAIDFFKDFDLSTKGTIRYGSVTHQELLNAVTPYGFHIYSGGINLLPKKK